MHIDLVSLGCHSTVHVYHEPFTKIGFLQNINLLLTEREGSTGEYWPKVVPAETERSQAHTKTTEGQYSPVPLELARLVSSLLYGTQPCLF